MADGRRPHVVVTGAHGYLGARIAAALEPVATVSRFVRPGSEREGDRPVELADSKALAALLASTAPDHVVHAAGRVSGSAEALDHDNRHLTEVLADAILQATPSTILTTLGSAAEYGDTLDPAPINETQACAPVSDYGRSKFAASCALLERAERSGLRANIVRPFNPIAVPLSPNQVLGSFVKKALAARMAGTETVRMGRLDAVRDVFAAVDLTDLVQSFVVNGMEGAIMNVCSGELRRIRDVIAFLNALPNGGLRVEEEGPPPLRESVIIGDPTRFLDYLGRRHAQPIGPILVEAWRQAWLSGAR